MGKHYCESDFIGKRFGKLIVISFCKREKGVLLKSTCLCDCGTTIDVKVKYLKNGDTQSCGCLQEKNAAKHGKTDTRVYAIWIAMKERCYYEKNKKYHNYGGRGIKVCDEWLNDFQAFYDWAMANGYADNLTIDRINTNENYEPSNCKWSTRTEQIRNRNARINSKSGVNGVSFYKNKCWVANIGVGYERIHLGYFDNLDEAIAARKAAEKEYWNKIDE